MLLQVDCGLKSIRLDSSKLPKTLSNKPEIIQRFGCDKVFCQSYSCLVTATGQCDRLSHHVFTRFLLLTFIKKRATLVALIVFAFIMCSFVDVLYQRYADSMCEDTSIELFIVGNFSPGKCGNQLNVPPALALSRCDIRKSGSSKVIRECCKEVEELDLASNCLTDLNQIFLIAKEMPFLKFLNLSENDLSSVDVEQIRPVSLLSVRSLVLNNTGVSWRAVGLLLDCLPSLNELHLSLNNYSSVDIGSKSYPQVKRIYISKNPSLNCWQQIGSLLAAFPRLQCLSMADCNVDTIPEKVADLLPCVQSLNISNWPLNCWIALERLNQMPKLFELRCQGLRLLHKYENLELRRQLLIARLPQVRRLNGSEITDDERLHAERAFIRYYSQCPETPKPKRYYDLFSIYGQVAPLAVVDLSPPKFAHVKITFNRVPSDHLNKENNNQIERRDMKIDLKQSVKNFKNQLSSMFGVPAVKMRLYYIDHEMVEITGPEELKFNQKKLYTYSVQDRDEFLVDEK